MKRRSEWFLAVAVLAAACSSSSNAPPPVNDADLDVAADAMDEAAADATPDVAPDVAQPDAAPDVVADAAPDAAPDASPDAAPDASPDAAPDATPDAMADAAADARPDATPDAAPDAAPDASPDAAADAAADARPDATPDAALDAAPDAAADAAIDARPDATPDAASDAADAAADAAGPSGSTRDLWLLRVGDGTAALTNASTALLIDRRAANDGAMRGAPIALPVAMSGANLPVTLSGTATSEGSLTRSVDGRFVTLAGYGAAPGMASIASTTVERVVARVAADGTVNSTTGLGMAYASNNVRGAVTVDGSAFWVAGTGAAGTAGIQYKALGATGEPTNVLPAPANVRVVGIFNGQLYGSASTSTPAPGFYGVFSVGTGAPTAAGATATQLAGFPAASGPSPYGFAALDLNAAVAGVDTLYVCDDRSIASGGGVQRWTLASAGGMWTLAATVNAGISSGCRGLTAWTEGADVFVAAVTAESTSRVVLYRERAGTTAGPFVVATAPTNTQFRGVALAPQ